MALTDREIIKERQAGVAQAYGLAATPKAAVAAVHTRAYVGVKTGTENAATAVAETVLFSVPRKGVAKTVKYINGTNIAASLTDFAYIVVGKSTAGAASTVIATWNTSATAVGGAMTKWVPAAFTVAPNADANIAAGDVITFTITKSTAGKLIDPGVFMVDIEEV